MQRIIVKKWKDISLVVPEKSDIAMWYKGMNDLEINTKLIVAHGRTYPIECEESFYENCNTWSKQTFVIWDNSKNIWLWNIWISKLNFKDRNAELWIVLFNKQNHWKWIWTQSILLMLDYCFNYLGLNKVLLYVLGSNEIAINCYKKCGFEEVGRLKKHCYLWWEYHDKVIMEVFNPKSID